MQSLKECYNNIVNDVDQWSYYNNPPAINGTLDNCALAYEFIKKYFDFAGKEAVFKDDFIYKNENQIRDRACHIISTFLLGLELAKCFDIDINNRNKQNLDFKYYWFLTCLYHDIGYVYEKDKDINFLTEVQNRGFDAIKSNISIRYLDNKIFKTYSKDVVEFYLKCRATTFDKKDGKLDHGIIGGILLYDKLRKQFNAWWLNRTSTQDTRESFCIRTNQQRLLHLSNKHYKEYGKAADAIVSHNIWLSRLEEYLDQYKPQGIKLPKKRISLKNELSFILCIADTIEPLKRGIKNLDTIQISKTKTGSGIELILSMDEENYGDSVFLSLSEWLDVVVKIEYDLDGKHVYILAKQ